MAFDILKKARSPLHVSDFLERIQSHFGVSVDRESLVSSLSKKVARSDRFPAPGKEHLRLAAGGAMSLLAEFLAITEDWRGVFPNSEPFSAPCGKRSVLRFV